jgi:hypothetical protein
MKILKILKMFAKMYTRCIIKDIKHNSMLIIKNKIVLTRSTSIPDVTTDGSELRISRVYIPQ